MSFGHGFHSFKLFFRNEVVLFRKSNTLIKVSCMFTVCLALCFGLTAARTTIFDGLKHGFSLVYLFFAHHFMFFGKGKAFLGMRRVVTVLFTSSLVFTVS